MLKKIGIVFFVLMALIVLNWWNVKQSKKKEASEEKQELLLALEKEDIQKVVINNANGQWELYKRTEALDGGFISYASFAKEFQPEPLWMVQGPGLNYLANNELVDLLLNELTQAKKDKLIAKNSEQLMDYGIRRDQSEIKIFTQNNVEPAQVLLTGDLNTAGTALYVAKDNNDIYLSSQNLKQTQTEQAKDYIYKKIVDFRDVTNIDFKNAQGHFVISKKDNAWHIQQPIKIKADQLAVESLLNHIETLTVENILSGDASEKIRKNLLKNAEFAFKVTDSNNQIKELYINQEQVAGNQGQKPKIYIYRNGLPITSYVFEKQGSVPDSFYYTMGNLGIKKVFSMKTNEVKGFKVIQNSTIKNFIQNKDEWIEEGSNGNKQAVNFGASYALFSLKAKKFLRLNKNEKLTIDYRLVIQGENEQEQTLIVYKEPYKHNNLSYTQAYSSAYNTQVLFDSKDIEAISNAVKAVVDLKK